MHVIVVLRTLITQDPLIPHYTQNNPLLSHGVVGWLLGTRGCLAPGESAVRNAGFTVSGDLGFWSLAGETKWELKLQRFGGFLGLGGCMVRNVHFTDPWVLR